MTTVRLDQTPYDGVGHVGGAAMPETRLGAQAHREMRFADNIARAHFRKSADIQAATYFYADLAGGLRNVVQLGQMVKSGTSTKGMQAIGMTGVTSVYTGGVTMSRGLQLYRKAQIVDDVRHKVIGILNFMRGGAETLLGALTVPFRALNIVGSNSSGLAQAAKGVGISFAATAGVMSTLMAIPMVHQIYASAKVASGISKQIKTGAPKKTLKYLTGLTMMSKDESLKIAKGVKLSDTKLAKKADGAYAELLDSQDLPQDEIYRMQNLVEKHGKTDQHRDMIAYKFRQRIERNRLHLKTAIGNAAFEKIKQETETGEMEALLATKKTDNVRQVKAFFGEIQACGRKTRMVLGVAVFAAALSVAMAATMMVAAPSVQLASQALSAAAAVIWLVVDGYFFKHEVENNPKILKEKVALFVLNLVILGVLVAATIGTGGAATIGVSVGAAVLVMAINLYIWHKNRRAEKYAI